MAKLTKTPPYPGYSYSGGNGQAWSVWADGVLLSKHRTKEAARARVLALEAALPAAAGRALPPNGEG